MAPPSRMARHSRLGTPGQARRRFLCRPDRGSRSSQNADIGDFSLAEDLAWERGLPDTDSEDERQAPPRARLLCAAPRVELMRGHLGLTGNDIHRGAPQEAQHDVGLARRAPAGQNFWGRLPALRRCSSSRSSRSSCRPTHVSLMACPGESGAVYIVAFKDSTSISIRRCKNNDLTNPLDGCRQTRNPYTPYGSAGLDENVQEAT